VPDRKVRLTILPESWKLRGRAFLTPFLWWSYGENTHLQFFAKRTENPGLHPFFRVRFIRFRQSSSPRFARARINQTKLIVNISAWRRAESHYA